MYEEILDPYIRLFAGLEDPSAQDNVVQEMQSYEYRKTAFNLSMVGADDVVKAYNGMMQYVFRAETSGVNAKEMMRLWGRLLLEIRKSLGNRSTELDEWDMLRGMIRDIDTWR